MKPWAVLTVLCFVVAAAWVVHQFMDAGTESLVREHSTQKLIQRNAARLKQLSEDPDTRLIKLFPRQQSDVPASLEEDSAGSDTALDLAKIRHAALVEELDNIQDLDNRLYHFRLNVDAFEDPISIAADLASALYDDKRFEDALGLLYELRLSLEDEQSELQLMQEVDKMVAKIEKVFEEAQDYEKLTYWYRFLIGLHADHSPYYLKLTHWYIRLGDVGAAEESLVGVLHDYQVEDQVSALRERIDIVRQGGSDTFVVQDLAENSRSEASLLTSVDTDATVSDQPEPSNEGSIESGSMDDLVQNDESQGDITENGLAQSDLAEDEDLGVASIDDESVVQ